MKGHTYSKRRPAYTPAPPYPLDGYAIRRVQHRTNVEAPYVHQRGSPNRVRWLWLHLRRTKPIYGRTARVYATLCFLEIEARI